MSFLADDFLIDWAKLTPERVEPELREALANARKSIDAYKSQGPADVNYAKTLLGLEKASQQLDRAWGLVSHLDSVLNSPELRKAYNALLPEVTAFYTSIALDPAVWSTLKAFAECSEGKGLKGVRHRFLAETVAGFVESGADLPPDKKVRLVALNAKLAEITQKYTENVLDSTNSWEVFVTDEKRLAGLPESARAAAKQSALSKERPEAWRFTLQGPSMLPVIQHAEDAELRREIWEASSRVGHTGSWDNTALVREIIQLRHEKAQLLGKASFADLVTTRRMVETGARALSFTDDLHKRVKARFDTESKELEVYRAKKQGDAARALFPWEFAYWSEKMRRELHGFDDESLRPWFPVDGVVKGMFSLFGGIMGFKVVGRDAVYVDSKTGERRIIRAAEPRMEAAPVAVWHPEVRFYEVRDGERHLGSFYTDWFPRESKRGGAWMNFFRTGGPQADGSFAPHLGLMCGNFTPPLPGKQALLTHDEVVTVFHEFGHLLHHLLCEVEVESLAGVRVAHDFVELPSQILENWCWYRESLDLFARHYETGEPLPDDLLAKLDAAANFRSASTCMRQLAFGKLDLDLHLRAAEAATIDLDKHWNETMRGWLPASGIKIPSMARRFNHLFSDATGYACGYYAYKWAEVLDADAFSRFKKEGLLNPKTGRDLREKILAKGNSEPAGDLFHSFMGRDPDPEAMLVRDGLA